MSSPCSGLYLVFDCILCKTAALFGALYACKNPALPLRARPAQRKHTMPNDPQTLIGLAVGAVIVLWLVFSVLKKLFGLALVASIIAVIAFFWFNPEMAGHLWAQAQMLLGMR